MTASSGDLADGRTAVVRPYAPTDRAACRRLCFETGYMGDPVGWLYPDRESFADMFCTWYLDTEPESAWVVDAGGGAIGYLLGCRDSDRAPAPERTALRHGVRRGLFVRPGTARFFGRAVIDLIAARGDVLPDVDLARYPAHLHIDLLPPARGHGLGRTLIHTWLDRLRAEAVPGVHLGTFAENTDAIAFFRACGFRRSGPPLPAPGFRTREGATMHSQLMVQDLR